MKEGYLQLKIAELNDKCKEIERLLSLEHANLSRIQEKVGEYKEVIKKFQHLDEFKQQSLRDIQQENDVLITKHIDSAYKQLHKKLQELVESDVNKINKTLAFLQERKKLMGYQNNALEQQQKNITFLREHNELLMMKLVNRQVLSGQDVAEMERRAQKKAEKKE
ncbi:MAG: hypothetical protein JW771_05100 [Candidatus Thermoplasmatota archaeon]|nr:hypothetical protein [Candidatus Thermoplasmatota archaeon]